MQTNVKMVKLNSTDCMHRMKIVTLYDTFTTLLRLLKFRLVYDAKIMAMIIQS